MNKTSKELLQDVVIQQLIAKCEALEAIQELSTINSKVAALTKEAKIKRTSILEGYGLKTGDHADIVNGNGKLVAGWIPQVRKRIILPEELKEKYSKPYIVNMLKIH